MKVKKKEVITMTLSLDAEESKTMKEILNYVYHRAVKHATYISRFGEQIKKMRKEFQDAEDDVDVEFTQEDKEDVEVW